MGSIWLVPMMHSPSFSSSLRRGLMPAGDSLVLLESGTSSCSYFVEFLGPSFSSSSSSSSSQILRVSGVGTHTCSLAPDLARHVIHASSACDSTSTGWPRITPAGSVKSAAFAARRTAAVATAWTFTTPMLFIMLAKRARASSDTAIRSARSNPSSPSPSPSRQFDLSLNRGNG